MGICSAPNKCPRIAEEYFTRARHRFSQGASETHAGYASEGRARQSAKNGERATRGDFHGNQHESGMSRDTTHQTLSDIGISRDQSSRWQRLADMQKEHFE